MDENSGVIKVTRELTRTGQYQLVIRVVNEDHPDYFTDTTVRV
jgi:hypothetical protein